VRYGGGPKIKTGSCWSPQTPLADKFLRVAIVPANAYQRTEFQLSSSISFGERRGAKIKSGSSRRPIADKFLYRTLARVNAYKCAKFQLPSSISYWDMERVPKYKLGAADLLKRLLEDKFLHAAIVPANACQRTKFQLSSSISFGDMKGSQNKNWELLICADAP